MSLARKVLRNPKGFYSIQEAIDLTIKESKRIPNVYDVIIGVPRAGLLFANIIASKYGRPLSTPDNFVRGEFWYSQDQPIPKAMRAALIVDDSVSSGKTMKNSLEKIQKAFPNLLIHTASVFVEPQMKNSVNYALKVKKGPNLFEWNIMSATWIYGPVIADMDGVLCEECPAEFDDDGEKYVEWIKNAAPRLLPTYSLKAIVTARLEKYREVTDTWLREHNVKYEQLIMLPVDTKQDRTFAKIINLKSGAVTATKPFWMWESDPMEARQIYLKTLIPVLCINTMTFLG